MDIFKPNFLGTECRNKSVETGGNQIITLIILRIESYDIILDRFLPQKISSQ
jgi:hypothetical protein